MIDLLNCFVKIQSNKTGKILATDTVIEHNCDVKRPFIRVKHNTKRYFLDNTSIQILIH